MSKTKQKISDLMLIGIWINVAILVGQLIYVFATAPSSQSAPASKHVSEPARHTKGAK